MIKLVKIKRFSLFLFQSTIVIPPSSSCPLSSSHTYCTGRSAGRVPLFESKIFNVQYFMRNC